MVEVVDRGRRRGFDSVRRSGAVILGYQREGGGGTALSVGLQRLGCDGQVRLEEAGELLGG
jgi:hypothetical protein